MGEDASSFGLWVKVFNRLISYGILQTIQGAKLISSGHPNPVSSLSFSVQIPFSLIFYPIYEEFSKQFKVRSLPVRGIRAPVPSLSFSVQIPFSLIFYPNFVKFEQMSPNNMRPSVIISFHCQMSLTQLDPSFWRTQKIITLLNSKIR